MNNIVKRIIEDFSERSGLGNEWDRVDGGLKKEIIGEWERIVKEEIMDNDLGTERYYAFDLDEHFNDLWNELEKQQDGRASHVIAMKGEQGKEKAVEALLHRLIPWFLKRVFVSDDCGNRKD